ncbi:MAG: flagellin, partial [Alphaproteobacteria bacterium]|nr:flagellin [Alphaproteobacteria bacterium]
MSGTRIQNNAMTQVKRHDEAKRQASARLASGQQINRASEGAADLAAASKLKSTFRASVAALSNANRGLSLGQIADGAMSQIQDLCFRMKELAVSSASDTFSDTDRADADKEYQSLKLAIDNIASRTRYAGQSLLNAATLFDVQTGEDGSTDTTSFTTADVTSATLTIATDISSKA